MFCGQCGREITNPNGICSYCGNVQTFDKSRLPLSDEFENSYIEPGDDGYYVNDNQGYYGDYDNNYYGGYNEQSYENDSYDYGYQKKRSGVVKPLIAALCGAAGLIAIVIVCYYFFLMGPDDIAKKWVNAANDQDIETIYDYLPREYQILGKEMIKADLVGEFDKAELKYSGRKGEKDTYEIGDKVKTDGKVYIYDVGSETISVFKQNGEWKVTY